MSEPTATLLPPASSDLERNTAATLADAVALPLPIRDLWNPQTCPNRLLPYLAWARSVDRWDSAWPGATKREVVSGAWWIHKRKGTIGAIRRVVETLGYLIECIEWFEEEPPAQPGTFRLRVGVLETGISDEMYQELERLIDDAKPLTRHMTGLAIGLEGRGAMRYGLATYQGDEMTVYPYIAPEIEVSGGMSVLGAEHSIDTMSIYP